MIGLAFLMLRIMSGARVAKSVEPHISSALKP